MIKNLNSENPAKELTAKLESEINALFKGEKNFDIEAYRKYLNVMSKFHNYSFRNCFLILMQNPEATHVAGFQAWTKSFKRYVKKGEKGLAILAPIIKKTEVQVQETDPKTNKPAVDNKNQPITKAVKQEQLFFKITYVFDISQTHGTPLPQIEKTKNLVGSAKQYDVFMDILNNISPYKITFQKLESANGYCRYIDRTIAINTDMSEIQTLKTTIHELAHAMLHSKGNTVRERAEVEAESIAYVVCQHLGIDTSEYSFPYIVGYSGKNEINILKESLQTIQKEASNIISAINFELEIHKNLEFEKEHEQKTIDLLERISDTDSYFNFRNAELQRYACYESEYPYTSVLPERKKSFLERIAEAKQIQSEQESNIEILKNTRNEAYI